MPVFSKPDDPQFTHAEDTEQKEISKLSSITTTEADVSVKSAEIEEPAPEVLPEESLDITT